jgi:hypothetical protein
MLAVSHHPRCMSAMANALHRVSDASSLIWEQDDVTVESSGFDDLILSYMSPLYSLFPEDMQDVLMHELTIKEPSVDKDTASETDFDCDKFFNKDADIPSIDYKSPDAYSHPWTLDLHISRSRNNSPCKSNNLQADSDGLRTNLPIWLLLDVQESETTSVPSLQHSLLEVPSLPDRFCFSTVSSSYFANDEASTCSDLTIDAEDDWETDESSGNDDDDDLVDGGINNDDWMHRGFDIDAVNARIINACLFDIEDDNQSAMDYSLEEETSQQSMGSRSELCITEQCEQREQQQK